MGPLLTNSQRIVVLFGAWGFLALALLAYLNELGTQVFYALCLMGFLIIAVLSGPRYSRPGWASSANGVGLTGALIFGLIVANRVLISLGIRLV